MTTDKCFSCERKDVSPLCGICGVGMNGEREHYKRKPITNADRIRAMTDEELAFYIVNHPMWSDESACVAWLKEPITGGESENPN